MLSKCLYDLCVLLSTPYNYLNLTTNAEQALDSSLLEEMYLKKLYEFKLRKKLKSSFENFQFDYHYTLLEQTSILTKIKLNLKVIFTTIDSYNFINSGCINEYVVILEYINDAFKIHFFVENEENPQLYSYTLNTSLKNIDNSIFLNNKNTYFDKLTSSNLLHENFTSSNLFSPPPHLQRNNTNFDVEAACTYAETFALKPNPDYKSFEGIGGDCTNFMSQILHAGGFKQDRTWKPYTNPWIRVEELYVYLTSRNLGIKLPNDSYLDKGCIIQFYTPSIGRYFHNGFITYKLQNNDCLYCCHSYNKLNYPLSEIYPNRYPKLRALKF
ncbi:amidase domain-containing protein [Clostridium sp.]|uniref:amidase domain-containing protein n=1 Tax=Clostridium sp. TaxID=1506 RepID=UPI00260F1766|nr:amidase domain-containing protein [Clostridium sp.]